MGFFKSTIVSFAAAVFFPLVRASLTREAEEWSGAQYIAFNGTVSGTVTYDNSDCTSPNYGPYVNSYLYVGVNPPWDTNPFFFELYHLASEGEGFLVLTEDRVYNLDFASSAYACWNDDGTPCQFFEYDYTFMPEKLLDLAKASVKKSTVEGEDGYEVSGSQDTYVKNETRRATINSVDVASGCYDSGIDWYNWIWNETQSWEYTVSFSNSSGKATLKTEISGSTMEITFSGERMTNSSWPDIELVTDDDSKPTFRYSNDSEIHFKNFSGTWRASPEEFTDATGTARLPTATSTGLRNGETSTVTGGANLPSSTDAAWVVKAPGALVSILLALGGFFVF